LFKPARAVVLANVAHREDAFVPTGAFCPMFAPDWTDEPIEREILIARRGAGRGLGMSDDPDDNPFRDLEVEVAAFFVEADAALKRALNERQRDGVLCLSDEVRYMLDDWVEEVRLKREELRAIRPVDN
jgi:hypothetical protein